MKNCLKSLLVVAVFVAASFVGVKGSAAATGTVTGSTAMGAVTINIAGGSSFGVNTTPPLVAWPIPPGNDLGLHVWTIACWNLQVKVGQNSVNIPGWVCSNPIDSGLAPASPSDVPNINIVGAIGASNPQACEPMENCGSNPIVAASLIPNLDAFVGQGITFDVTTNWCSYLGPANSNLSVFGSTPIGCAMQDPVYTLASTSGSVRTLASASPSSLRTVLHAKVGASSYDCHVPYVKGLKLRKAKTRLHKANCGASVRYVKGTRAGRVRYQPLAVGTGKPRGFKVKLAVVR